MTQYPLVPGFKTVCPETSVVAALNEASRVITLREAVFRCLSQKERTADQCAQALDKSILAIRPRLSELRAMGKIHDTGRRSRNASGHKAAVWAITTAMTQQNLL